MPFIHHCCAMKVVYDKGYKWTPNSRFKISFNCHLRASFQFILIASTQLSAQACPNIWRPKKLKSLQIHPNITKLCPAMVACWYFTLNWKQIHFQFFLLFPFLNPNAITQYTEYFNFTESQELGTLSRYHISCLLGCVLVCLFVPSEEVA